MTQAPEATPQSVADYAYRKEYLAWVSSLTPADRHLLKTMGIDKPDCTRGGGAGIPVPESIEDTTVHAWHPGEIVAEDDDSDELPHLVHDLDVETVRALVGFLVPATSRLRWRRAATRLATLARWIDPEIGSMSLDALAAEFEKSGISLTKQRLSQLQVDLGDALGTEAPGGKTNWGREQYRQAAIRVWETRGTKPKSKKGAALDQSNVQSRELTDTDCVSN